MSTITLPRILQSLIDTLLKDSPISSWNIRSEGTVTNLNIRFSNDNMDTIDNVTYRKSPPSRVARDKKRYMDRDNYTSSVLGSDNIHQSIMTQTDFEENINSQGIDQGTSPIEFDCTEDQLHDTESQPSEQGDCSMACADYQSSHMHPSLAVTSKLTKNVLHSIASGCVIMTRGVRDRGQLHDQNNIVQVEKDYVGKNVAVVFALDVIINST